MDENDGGKIFVISLVYRTVTKGKQRRILGFIRTDSVVDELTERFDREKLRERLKKRVNKGKDRKFSPQIAVYPLTEIKNQENLLEKLDEVL